MDLLEIDVGLGRFQRQARGQPTTQSLPQAGDIIKSLTAEVVGQDHRSIALPTVEYQPPLCVRLAGVLHEQPRRRGDSARNKAAVQFVGLAHIHGYSLLRSRRIRKFLGVYLRQMRQFMAHLHPIVDIREIPRDPVQADAIKRSSEIDCGRLRGNEDKRLIRVQNPSRPGDEQRTVRDVVLPGI